MDVFDRIYWINTMRNLLSCSIHPVDPVNPFCIVLALFTIKAIFIGLHSKLSHLSIQIRAMNAKRFCRLADVPAGCGDRLLDVRALKLVRRVVELASRADAGGTSRGHGREDEREVL